MILVKLTYAPGWRLPGGGRGPKEEPLAAALRELREEIGLSSHGRVERLADALPGSSDPGDRSSLFLVEDTVYAFRRSFEVEEAREFDPFDLPEDVGPWAREAIALCGRLRKPA